MAKGKKEKTGRTHTKKAQKFLKCILTQEELLMAGQRMADAQQRMVQIESEMEVFKAQHKQKIAEQSAILSHSTLLITNKYEPRQIACTDTYLHDEEQVITTRDDTGEEVERRRMTNEELEQLPLDTGVDGGALGDDE